MTKLAAEHLCVLYGAEHGVDTVALRYFSVYGPRQRPDMAFRRFCEAIVAGEPIEVFGDGRQTRDFTYVADIVAATRAAGEARHAARAACSTSAAASRVERQPRARDARGLAGRPLDVRHCERQSGDVRDTGADTDARPRGARLRARDRRSRTGSPPSWTGCASAPSPCRG